MERETKRTILLVDDDERLVASLSRRLRQERQEWRILTAVNGLEALRVIAESEVDAVVTDILMPEMDGIELVMELRRRYPEIGVVAASGGGRRVGAEVLEICAAMGVSTTLRKPFELSMLVASLDALLDPDRSATGSEAP